MANKSSENKQDTAEQSLAPELAGRAKKLVAEF